MSQLKKMLHGSAMAASRIVTRLLPDKVPVTFVGADATRELAESIAHDGARHVLVVTDAVLVEIGLVAKVTAALESAGLRCTVFSEVEPDPTFPQVEAGAKRLADAGCDAVVAVGGGSSMDASKVIAAMATNPVPVRKLEGPMKVRNAPLPLYAVPTTAGTGSEATIVAVVSDPDSHTKHFFIDPKLLPRMAALDPGLMAGMPPAVTAATGMDALTHAIESYLAGTATDSTKAYATTAVRLVFEHLPTAYREGTNLASRKAMALASFYGGLAFTRTSVGYVHAIAHTFGAFYGTPHGLANAIALPRVLDFSKPEAEARLAELGRLIGLGGEGDAASAASFIDAVRRLEREVGIPEHLAPLKEADIPRIARQAVDEAHLNYPVPRYMTRDECESLLRDMLA